MRFLMRRILLLLLSVFTLSFATPEEEVDKMLLKAWQYYEQGNYYMMLEQSKKTIEYAKKENVPKGIAEGYYYAGIAYFQMGDMNKAIEYANKAIEYSKDKPNYRWKAYSHNLLAEIMLYLKKYDDALKHFEITLKLAKENNNERMVPVALLNIGNVYFYKKDYNKALDYYKEAIKNTENIKIRPYYIALINYNTGMAYYKLKDYKNASFHLEKAALTYKEIGDLRSSVESVYFLAKSFINLNEKEKAIQIINEYKPLAKKVLLYGKFKKLEKEVNEANKKAI
jgi:tetratricopeptide (TPR) repeat protein